MAKRFIDTTLFRKSFVRGLPAEDKALWIILFCECSNAGIYDVDLEVLSIYSGQKITLDKLKTSFGSKLYFFDNDKKIFIPSFIEFQYGHLSETNNPQKSVIKELKKYKLLNDDLEVIDIEAIEGLGKGSQTLEIRDNIDNQSIEGLGKGSPTLQEQEQDKEQDKEKEKTEKENSEKIKNELDLKSLHLFKNSPFIDLEVLKTRIGKEYLKYDVDYYHKRALNYSQSQGKMYKDWCASIRNFMLGDEREGKAVLQGQKHTKQPVNNYANMKML